MDNATPAVWDAFHVAFHLAAADFATWENTTKPDPTPTQGEREAGFALQTDDDAIGRFLGIPSACLRVLFLTMASVPAVTRSFDEARAGAPVVRSARVMRGTEDADTFERRCARLLTALSALTQAMQLGCGRLARLMPDMIFTTMELCLDGRRGGVSGDALNHMHKKGITKGAGPTRSIMHKTARLVRPEIFFAPSVDGCVPMTIHTGDNMD